MATDIYQYLQEIQEGRYGVDIRIPIYNALAILADENAETIDRASDGYPVNSPVLSDYDISEELYVIAHSITGSEVKDAIYSALDKLDHLAKESRTVMTGLTGISLADVSRPTSHDDYISGLTGTMGETDFETLKDFLLASGLFTDVTYEEVEGSSKGLTIYVGENVLAELKYVLDWTQEEASWFYNLVVHTNGTLSDDTLSFPREQSDVILQYSLAPQSAIRTSHGVIITCETNSIAFSRNTNGGISVSCGYDVEKFSTVPDVKRRIRTFTRSSTISTDGGVGHSRINSNVCTLTPLVSEGDGVISEMLYGITAGNILYTDGVVAFGDRRLYLSNDMFAIEI
jgi:hypothetical protein